MSKVAERSQIAIVVGFYIVAALVMIFVNKAVLNSTPQLPYLFLFMQMMIAVLLLHISACFLPKVVLPTVEELTLYKTKSLAPVVLVNIIGLIFNTLCLRDVDASFFQIARGLVLPLTILVSSCATHSRPSLLVLTCATIVTIGFFVGVTPLSFFSSLSPSSAEAQWSAFSSSQKSMSSPIVSLIYGVLSSLFIALHAVLIKSSLPHVDESTIKLAWWTNVGSALALIPCIIFSGEISQVAQTNLGWSVFIWGSAVTGIFGFLLCIAGLLSIKVTSPITHMFSSAAKGVLQALLGVWIFQDILTVTRATSIFVILSGTILYTWIKSRDARSSRSPSQQRMTQIREEENMPTKEEK